MKTFVRRFPVSRGVLLGLSVLVACAASAAALDYQGSSSQFGGGFAPSVGYGGFGGGSCSVDRVPVVFIHGNGDEARNWDFPSSTGVPSVYDALRADGYDDCELFGVTWLSSSERALPQLNYHRPSKTSLLSDFLVDVMSWTGSSQVDLVAHSFGVTMALETLDQHGLWSHARRFVAIGGGMRGLSSCYWVGNANPAATTCGSQNIYDSRIFGFYPHSWWTWNPRMSNGGFRDAPSGRSTLFYSLSADIHDQVLCGTTSSTAGCGASARFDNWSNVRAQLDVGYGTPATGVDFDFSDWTLFNLGGGDIDGVGHFRSRNNTGRLVRNMLRTSCTGTGCCAGYGDVCG
ncbi:MAG: lipase [Acidobacteriota bacterium]